MRLSSVEASAPCDAASIGPEWLDAIELARGFFHVRSENTAVREQPSHSATRSYLTTTNLKAHIDGQGKLQSHMCIPRSTSPPALQAN
jgi:hypothetical protein